MSRMITSTLASSATRTSTMDSSIRTTKDSTSSSGHVRSVMRSNLVDLFVVNSYGIKKKDIILGYFFGLTSIEMVTFSQEGGIGCPRVVHSGVPFTSCGCEPARCFWRSETLSLATGTVDRKLLGFDLHSAALGYSGNYECGGIDAPCLSFEAFVTHLPVPRSDTDLDMAVAKGCHEGVYSAWVYPSDNFDDGDDIL